MEEFYKNKYDKYIYSFIDGRVFCEVNRSKIYQYYKNVKNEEQSKYLCEKMAGKSPDLNKYWKLISIST